MTPTVRRWEVAGVFVIILAGSAAHFAFAWLGYWPPAALLFAVNESTWEHLKLAFWPGLVFALVEYPFVGRTRANYWLAKTLSLYVMPVAIVTLFYAYKAVLGTNYFSLALLTFVLAVLAGQWTSYRVLTARPVKPYVQRWVILGLIPIILAFSLLTYHPPRIFLFQHPGTGEYGILQSYRNMD